MAKNGRRQLDLASMGFRAGDGCEFQTATSCGTSARAPWKRAASITGRGESFRSRNVRRKSWRRCAVRHAVPYRVRVTVTPAEREGVRHKRPLLLPGGRLLQAYRGGADRKPPAPSRHRGDPTGRAVCGEAGFAGAGRRVASSCPSPNGSPRWNARRRRTARIFLRRRKIVWSMSFRSPNIATRPPTCWSRRFPRACSRTAAFPTRSRGRSFRPSFLTRRPNTSVPRM